MGRVPHLLKAALTLGERMEGKSREDLLLIHSFAPDAPVHYRIRTFPDKIR